MSALPPPRAVLFDLDGTLIDSAPDLVIAVEALCRELGAPPPEAARVREVVSAGGRAMLRRGLPGSDETMIDQLLPRFLDIYSANMAVHTCLYDGMGDVLEGFESQGIAWGVVTNKSGWLTRPLLEQMCRKVEHCGKVGAGSAMKLAINLPLMVAWQAYGEAFAIARSVGWDAKRLVDLFNESNGGNKALNSRAEMIAKLLDGQDPGATTFSIANGVKDLRTMVTAGEALGAEMLATKAALAGFEEAVRSGEGGSDGAAMTAFWSSRKKK